MNILPLLALATGLNLAALSAQAAPDRAAEARLDTLVSAAEPALAARGVDAALAAGLHRYAQTSADQIAAARPPQAGLPASAPVAVQPSAAADPQDYASAAEHRLDTLVDTAAPQLHRQAVDAALIDGARQLGLRVDTQIAAQHSNTVANDEVAVLRARSPGATIVHSNAP